MEGIVVCFGMNVINCVAWGLGNEVMMYRDLGIVGDVWVKLGVK